MIRPYSAYKDSGAGWVGKVPEHWRVEKFRWLTTLSRQKNDDDVERPMLSLSAYDGIKFKKYEYETQKRTKEQNIVYMVVKPKQLVVNPMWVMKRSIAVSELNGIVSPAYRVYNISDDYLPKYFHYLMRSDIYVDEYNRHIRGLTTYDRSVRKDDFAQLLLPIPSIEEQKAIVAFLEEQTAVIDKFITNKQQLIKLLEEQKQAVINTAVTQGLETAVVRKPSGIDWIGDIPAHWRRLILRRCVLNIEQGWSPQCFNWQAKQGGWGVLKVGAVNSGIFKSYENKELPEDLQPRKEYEIREGDFLVSRANSKELVGSAAVVNQVRPKLLLCDKLYRIRLNPDLVVPQFMAHVFATPFLRYQIESLASGSSDSMQNISQEKVKGLEFVLPTINDQLLIIEYIKEKTVVINTTIERAQQEIDLIKEYRTTLIATAVTGKIDVRPQPEVT